MNRRSNVKIQARFFSIVPRKSTHREIRQFRREYSVFRTSDRQFTFCLSHSENGKKKNRQILREFPKRRRFWKFYEVHND